jgi:ABC-2 type transport system ATP-binding protein
VSQAESVAERFLRARACHDRLVPADAAISTHGLTKDFGEGRGLFGLDLEVARGEVMGFLGPNGAGKSTTMKLLLDQLRPTAGSASVLGLDVHVDSLEVRQRVGFLPGDFALYPKLTGDEVLDWFASLRGGVDRRVQDELVERFEAGHQLDRPVRELSTGNRQKLGLIQAFMHEPELLILDEPIAGLDPLVQQRFHALLGEVAAAGRTVFLSSHTLSEVERVAHRVAILREGKLVVIDTLAALRAVAVRRLEVEFGAGGPSEEQVRAVAGVREAKREDQHMVIAFEGSADPLVRFLAAYEVRALRSRDDDLEDIFLGYYRG